MSEPGAVLVHVTDLHFTTDEAGLEQRRRVIRNRLKEDLDKILATKVGQPADAVLVTGDVAYSGRPEEYQVASDWLENLVEPAATGPVPVLVVPGNHDVDWNKIGPTHKGHRAIIGDVPDHGLDALLDDFLREADQAILQPLSAYNEFAASLACQMDGSFCWDRHLPIGGGYFLDVRGIATPVNSFNDDRPGALAVHSNQLAVDREPGAISVLLAHHDPHYWRRSATLEASVRNRMVLALYGHTHNPRHRMIDGCFEVTGGAVQPEEAPDWAPTYNVIEITVVDIDRGALRIRVWPRRFSVDHDRFITGAADGLFEEQAVAVDPPERPTVEAAAPVAEDHAVDAELEVAPAPTTSDDEGAHMLLTLQGELYHLGAGERITILDDLGIEVDALATLPPYRLIPQAAAAIMAVDKTDEFLAAATKTRLMNGDAGV
jgi:predicted MPP superfamily phosphohydrolase